MNSAGQRERLGGGFAGRSACGDVISARTFQELGRTWVRYKCLSFNFA